MDNYGVAKATISIIFEENTTILNSQLSILNSGISPLNFNSSLYLI